MLKNKILCLILLLCSISVLDARRRGDRSHRRSHHGGRRDSHRYRRDCHRGGAAFGGAFVGSFLGGTMTSAASRSASPSDQGLVDELNRIQDGLVNMNKGVIEVFEKLDNKINELSNEVKNLKKGDSNAK